MEVENTSKQTNQAQIIPENQPAQNIINNQRGNVPIIIGGIVLLLVVGIGAFVLGQKTNTNQTTNSSQQPQAAITNTVTQPSPTSASISTPDAIP